MSGDSLIPMLALGVATGGASLAAAGVSVGALSGTGLALAGVGAGATLMQAGAAAQASKAQARESKLRMSAERTDQALRDEERARRLRAIIASQTAQAGASGVGVGVGTPSLLSRIDSSAAAREQDIERGGSRLRQGILGMNARSARRAGGMSLVAGVLSAGTQFGSAVHRAGEVG